MEDGEHKHNDGNTKGLHKHKKILFFGIFALLLSLIAFSIAQTAQETADINNVFEVVVNNTDLYRNGRLHNTVYYSNTSPIQVLLIFHVLGTGAAQVIDTNVTINGTVVLDRDYRTTAGAGLHEHFSYAFLVPKGSNYSITNSTNVHDIEWREYPILSGKNGTLSINQTIISNGTGNIFNDIYVNRILKNDTSINQTIYIDDLKSTHSQFDIFNNDESCYILLDSITPQVDLSCNNGALQQMLNTHDPLSNRFTISNGINFTAIDQRTFFTTFSTESSELLNISNQNITSRKNINMSGNNISDVKYINSNYDVVLNTTSDKASLNTWEIDANNRITLLRRVTTDINTPQGIMNIGMQGSTVNNTGESILFSIDAANGTRYFIGRMTLQVLNFTDQSYKLCYNVRSGPSDTFALSEVACFYSNQTFVVNNLAGVGNRSVCARSDGSLYAIPGPC